MDKKFVNQIIDKYRNNKNGKKDKKKRIRDFINLRLVIKILEILKLYKKYSENRNSKFLVNFEKKLNIILKCHINRTKKNYYVIFHFYIKYNLFIILINYWQLYLIITKYEIY